MTPSTRSLCIRTLGAFALVAACSSGGEDGSRDTVNDTGAGGAFTGAGGGSNPGTGNTVNPGAGGRVTGPNCGNGVVDPGEECDGSTQTTCAAATMGAAPSGTVSCSGCQLNTSGCGTQGGSGGVPVGTGGGAGTGNVPGNTGGMGQAGSASSGGAPVGSGGTPSADGLDALRQVCVDTINAHRATVGMGPLSRATPAQETCSDRGAQQDGTTGDAHGSAGSCDGLGAQNTCPGWDTDRPGGEAAALTACLQMMWEEGEPPVPRNQCTGACFQTYGHYLNMTSGASVVSCGFYRMPNNEIWMNQDFGR